MGYFFIILVIINILIYLSYLVYISFIYNNTKHYTKLIIFCAIQMIPIIILAIKCAYSKDYMTAICILTSSCLLLYTQTYSIVQCTSCIGDYDNYISDKELDTTYIKQVKIHQKYLFIKSIVCLLLFSLVGFAVHKLESNLSGKYIFNSVFVAYTIYILVDNLSYLKPSLGYLEKPKLINSNEIITEKLQDNSLTPIYLSAMWFFICLIILNDFHKTDLHKSNIAKKIPQFGGGLKLSNHSSYLLVVYVFYNYISNNYINNNCTEWRYEKINQLNNLRKININSVVSTVVLFIIFLFKKDK